MNLFLQGPSGIGKSTLLQQALSPYSHVVGGFSVQRLTGAASPFFRLVGLTGSLPPLEAPASPLYTQIFLSPHGGRLKTLYEAIQNVEKISASHPPKLLLLDEIGGIELASPAFMASLTRLLKGHIPCMGVVKSHENLKRTLKGRVDKDYQCAHKKLVSLLLETGELIAVTPENRPYTLRRAEDFIHHIMKGEANDSGLGRTRFSVL